VLPLRPSASMLVACGQGLRQDTMRSGHLSMSSVGTKIALPLVADTGLGRCLVIALDRFTSPHRCTNRKTGSFPYPLGLAMRCT
jgi:hypothetical protein